LPTTQKLPVLAAFDEATQATGIQQGGAGVSGVLATVRRCFIVASFHFISDAMK
jgi:hypothetical protein